MEEKLIGINELKKLELDILKAFARFCDDNNIKYYLGGGTLLGAVRHEGFIPWDDDIDIMMPRPDYDRLIATFNGFDSNYCIRSIENDKTYWRPFAKIFDVRTRFEEDWLRVPTPGNAVSIDIFPIDGIPQDKKKQKMLFKTQELLVLLYRGAAYSMQKSYKYSHSQSLLLRLKGHIRTAIKYCFVGIMYPVPAIKIARLINQNARKYEYDSCELVGAITECLYGAEREILIKTKFEIRQKFVFEDSEFWGTKDYDTYLSNLYGDYMKLPPIDKQQSHHRYKASWIENR